jgi:hypothetical protein
MSLAGSLLKKRVITPVAEMPITVMEEPFREPALLEPSIERSENFYQTDLLQDGRFKPIDRIVMHASEWHRFIYRVTKGETDWALKTESGMFLLIEKKNQYILLSYGHHSSPVDDHMFMTRKEYSAHMNAQIDQIHAKAQALVKDTEVLSKEMEEEVI